MTAMSIFATVVLAFYALIMLAGGIIGYRAAGSRPSLFSGAASALLLFAALFWAYFSSPRGGFFSGAFVALALSVIFARRLACTRSFLPSGLLLAISIFVLVVLAIAGAMAPGVYPAV